MQELNYHGYRIINVFGPKGEDLRAEIVQFWLRNRALTDVREAQRRSHEVVFTIRNPRGELCGVNTLYVADFLRPGNAYYFHRMFIQPPDRISGMMRFVTAATLTFLRDLDTPDKPNGVVGVAENVKFRRKGARRTLERLGFQWVGRDARGCDVWKVDF